MDTCGMRTKSGGVCAMMPCHKAFVSWSYHDFRLGWKRCSGEGYFVENREGYIGCFGKQ